MSLTRLSSTPGKSTPLHLVVVRVKNHQTAIRCNKKRSLTSMLSNRYQPDLMVHRVLDGKHMCATFRNESTTFERWAHGLFTLRFSRGLLEQTPAQRVIVTSSLLLITIAGHRKKRFLNIAWVKRKRTSREQRATSGGSRIATNKIVANLPGIYYELVRPIRACSLS